MSKVKVLVVEDERIVAKDIQNTLRNLGYEVPAIASTGEDAIKMSGELQPDIILMDIVLKGEIDGIDAARRVAQKYAEDIASRFPRAGKPRRLSEAESRLRTFAITGRWTDARDPDYAW